MLRRPPRSTRTDTLFPYTTLFRSFDVIEVSVYLPGAVELNTIHGASGDKTSISAPGNFTQTAFTAVRTSDHRPLLAGVDVLGKAARPVLVAFGDSITDNTGCAIDAVPISIGRAPCREGVCKYV